MGFIAVSIFVVMVPFSFIDQHISEEVQERNSSLLYNVMYTISWFGNIPVSLIMVFLTALLFFVFRFKREAVYILITLSSGIISSIVKYIVNRPRPAKNLVKVLEHARQQSFPSGHVLFYTVFFGLIIIIMSQIQIIPKGLKIIVNIISCLMIFFVPVSRIYLGAHWFTDVLGGFILGIICLFILAHFYLKKFTM